MLKSLIINQASLPIPVPVLTGSDLLGWLIDSMLPQGKSITSLIVEGEQWIDKIESTEFEKLTLMPLMKVEVLFEAGFDLTLRSMEVTHNLCRGMLSVIKVIAVNLWQSATEDDQSEFLEFLNDLELLDELMLNIDSLATPFELDLSGIYHWRSHLKVMRLRLHNFSREKHWQSCAKLLLRDESDCLAIETSLKKLFQDLEFVHLELLRIGPKLASTG
jgi:hypothetical protein